MRPIEPAPAIPASPVLAQAAPSELAAWLERAGEPAFRARQIRRWIFQGRAAAIDEMTDLPKHLRERLALEWRLTSSRVLARMDDRDFTKKLLLGLDDGRTVECVLLLDGARRTVCLSTQVGCGMGCVFCASGIGGVVRNLSAGEMVEEFFWLSRLLPPEERLSHVVVMGMGEPMANLDALLAALQTATARDGFGISARHVTISTVGLPGKMARLAASGKPYHLAVSLHAPNDEIRARIVPTAERVPLAEILAAADDYRAATGRQVTFEYVLLSGINDAPEHARELARLLKRRDAMINLIPYNPVPGLPYETPASSRSREFAEILRGAGLVVKIRKRRGAGIDAACGQLRRSAVSADPLPRVAVPTASDRGAMDRRG